MLRAGVALVLSLSCSVVFSFGGTVAAPLLAQQARGGGQGAGRGAVAPTPNAIVGRVTDQAGQPVASVFMTALRPAASATRPFSFVSAKLYVETDVNGHYRIDGLPVGDYFVLGLPKNDPASSRPPARAGFGKTFFPSASETTHARLVHVDGGTPARADLTLVPVRLASISGVVIGSSGQPATGGLVELAHGDNLFGLGSRAFRVPQGGAFTIPAVPPGTYFLQFHESDWPPAPGVVPLVSQARVVVAGEDVATVRVVPIHMVEAVGRVVMDRATRAAIDPTSITIGASPISFDGNPGPQQPGSVHADLTFRFKTWPSQGRLRVFSEAEWYITSIRLNGADLTNAPIDFIEGHDIRDLEVHVARRR